MDINMDKNFILEIKGTNQEDLFISSMQLHNWFSEQRDIEGLSNLINKIIEKEFKKEGIKIYDRTSDYWFCYQKNTTFYCFISVAKSFDQIKDEIEKKIGKSLNNSSYHMLIKIINNK